jgi:hypothetical protein
MIEQHRAARGASGKNSLSHTVFSRSKKTVLHGVFLPHLGKPVRDKPDRPEDSFTQSVSRGESLKVELQLDIAQDGIP